ncbi:hypothetical protein [Streptomyces sp. NPDC008150]|uniref:hypothetical protein n=1 Tax=Streptomyces sp. NPDC008150 TaxID=3364816 RepID=UPI0036E13867
MKVTIRRIAVSGSAAVALLGGAAAITAATPAPASAAELDAHITRATGTAVTLPDGRTMHVTGLDNAAYRTAHAGHTVTVADTGATTTVPATQQVPAGYTQQVTTQSAGGTIAVSIVAILILGIIVFVKVKHSGLKASDAALGVLFGLTLSGTFIGTMGTQMTNSLVGSLGNALSSLG